MAELSSDDWREIEDAFNAALDLPAHERAPYLATLNAGLRGEVESLIASSKDAAPALRSAVASEADRMAGAAQREMVGLRVGAYRLLEPLGEGGMGTVYAAERADDQYHAQVAVKVLRSLGAQAVARFRDERQILAALEHPGIVRLVDGGATDDGHHYLVMERIAGVPITTYARDHHLSLRDRLVLLRQVCSAVQYAHGKLVVHRDLKPSNILVDAGGAPRLLDFGIAKLLDPAGPEREAHTRTGVALLTPGYASPEQARGEGVTVATDVYSLGAVMFELLADKPPYDATGLDALRVICEVDAPKPSSLAPPDRRRALRGDLDNIVGMALQKAPARRYASIAALSDDLGRYLDGLPVVARTPTLGYRTGKYLRRNGGKVAIAAAVATALAVSSVYSAREAALADEQSHRAQRRFEDVRKLADTLLFQIDDGIRELKGATAVRELVVSSALEYLDRLAAEAGDDVGLELDLARAYMKIGDVQGSLAEANLGRPLDGLVSYGKATAILVRVLVAHPGDPEAQREMAVAQLGAANIEVERGGLEHATALMLDGLARADELPPEHRLDPSLAIRAYNYLLEVTPDPRQSKKWALAAIATAEQWYAREHTPDSSYWLGIADETYGWYAGLAADADAAQRSFEKGLALFEVLSKNAPDDFKYAREVAIAEAVTAMFSAGIGAAELWKPSVGDLPLAEQMMRKSADTFAALAGHDAADARLAADNAAILGSLAATVAERSCDEALPLYRRALASYDAMPKEVRDSENNMQSEWFVHCTAAETFARTGHRAEALEQARIGLAQSAAVGRDLRGSATLDTCRYLVARAQRALGDLPAALALLDASRAALEPRVTSDTPVIADRIGYREVLELTAELRPDEACALRERAAAAWRRWPGAPTAFLQKHQARLDAAAAACKR